MNNIPVKPRLLFIEPSGISNTILELYGVEQSQLRRTAQLLPPSGNLAEEVQSFIDNAGDRLQDSWIHAPLVAELLQSSQNP
jgi:hypothetical protein